MKVTWNDKQGSRDRKAAAIIVTPDGNVHDFKGVSIHNVCHVQNSKYTKDGKWSNTTYEILIDDNAALVAFRQDFETGQYWPQGCWGDAYTWLNEQAGHKVNNMEAFEAFIRENYPKTAERFDQQEVAAEQFGEQPK